MKIIGNVKNVKKISFLFILLFFVSYSHSFPNDLVHANCLSNNFTLYGSTASSSYRGDLYGFDVHIYGMENYSVTGVDVYLQIVLPEGGIKLYQLDYLHHKKKQKYVSYSCELCLTQIGKYQSMYFAVDRDGNKFFDPQVYEFAVFDDHR